MFTKFCLDNHIGPFTAGALLAWIGRNHYGFSDLEDLGVLWSEYLEEEQADIQKRLAELRQKGREDKNEDRTDN